MSLFNRLFSKNSLKYWLILVVFIVSSWPLLHSGMFKIHDFTHGARIVEMTRALQDGHFPVRWTQNFGFGYGMPLFQFYGPLPFYIGSIYYWLTNYVVGSVKFIFLFSNLFTLLGSYLLGKKIFKKDWPALITSFAFTLAPYRFLNLYVRGAVNELWGMMALPWIIWSVIKVINQEKWGWLGLSLSLSTLFLSHNISTMIFAPFIVGVILLLLFVEFFRKKSAQESVKKSLITLISSGMLSVGLSAFYLFPAYLEKNLTQVENFILADYFNFRIHFLYLRQFFKPNWGFGGSEYGPNDLITFFLGDGQIIALIFAIFVIFYMFLKLSKSNNSEKNQLYFIFGIMILFAASLFMTLPQSEFIWNNIKILEFTQFPWRFLGMASFLLSIIAGWVVLQTNKLLKKQKFLNIAVLSITLVGLLMNLRFVNPELFLDDSAEYYYSDPIRIRSEMSQILPDYLPSDFNLATKPAENLVINADNYSKDNIIVLTDKTQLKQFWLKKEVAEPWQLELAIANYPGWQGWSDQALNGQGRELLELNTSDNGLILIKVEPGTEYINLKFSQTNLRKFSDLVSLASLLVVVYCLFNIKIKIQPK